jgi:hypothetical protein
LNWPNYWRLISPWANANSRWSALLVTWPTPSIARLEAQRLMDLVIDHLLRASADRPQDILVNSVLTITAARSIRVEPLP